MEKEKKVKGKRIAIVGFSESTRHLAPYNEPDVEIWGCNHVLQFIPRVDVLFELHDMDELKTKYGPNLPSYLEQLKRFQGPVFMKEHVPEIPSSTAYPIDEIKERFGFHHEFIAIDPEKGTVTGRERSSYSSFKSSISYMLAMVPMEAPQCKEVMIYGVDMIADTEWGFQRHNLYLFIGWLRGLGFNVVIPDRSALLKEGNVQYYAYEHRISKYEKAIAILRRRVAGINKEMNEGEAKNVYLANEIERVNGQLREMRKLKTLVMNGGLTEQDFDEREKELISNQKDVEKKNMELMYKLMYLKGKYDTENTRLERMFHEERGEEVV